MKKIKYLSRAITIVFMIFLLLATAIYSFLFGLHWHGTISEKIVPKKLTCYEHNNFWEAFQVNCLYPLNKNQKEFKFSNHLNCSLITNHQLNNVDKNHQLESESVYDEVMVIKTDYRSFNLDFDYRNNEIKRSRDPGEPIKEPYVIIQNDERVVNAIRKTKLDDFFGYEYQYVTISKKTGKGIITWTNTQDYNSQQDSFASEFFQCE